MIHNHTILSPVIFWFFRLSTNVCTRLLFELVTRVSDGAFEPLSQGMIDQLPLMEGDVASLETLVTLALYQ